ncbi:DeoR/GlpR family DNA-binding transcription regulator [Clostridium saccharobutylicum]|uniref:HTH-type transcriptional regulator FruR n=1 Tax=Clostridium saccharobutylicum DSM 13864 TaxID=1345695 RepID=U5MU49_CLOSA|nr:DeoR/GlpR family DNA-binding transcription regulator [Clostridium saccharobutylicum]AGX43191.1 HTH-type transcriptional regulator FruR [Clostridium saccharobutylicum DSM 13864]AQR90490.1 lactose phosphotransferase system repressor [Clostridium saccharobutylicum]AQS00396.1 lactose phosphotransferase system repressor [Clostridium saccharobutylicum]AQS14379.1 lactose phosphotransferase system repressor [Clostridium saccharobutylicum]MBA2906664.1 DeoR family fructose operon transcriptional repr
MFTEERYNIILQELKQKGIVSVTDLVNILDASESTVRRDLNSLDSEGLLKKIHGGAILIGESTSKHDYQVNVRQTLNSEEKKLIAKYAAGLIKENDVIYLDAGTTTELLIDFIEAKNITVVTNGISHAKKLLEKGIKTFILGGELKAVTEAIVGSSAVDDLKKFNFSKAFLGTNGVSNKNGYTTPDMNEAMVKAEAMKRSSESFVLADQSKLEEVSFITFGAITDSTLITIKINGNNNSYDTNVIGVVKND